MKLFTFFDKNTMSVHLKEGVVPRAKVGVPGNWTLTNISSEPLDKETLTAIYLELEEYCKNHDDGRSEIRQASSVVMQIRDYRIVVVMPPLADALEITTVKPIRKLSLADYPLSQKLTERITHTAEGILVAGAPGMGKSTFIQALGEFYACQHKIVKTIEAPRDLKLQEDITQYALSHATSEEMRDIILLSRPDYTLFDEMRNTGDFRLFADLRLSGVGMIGVVHATKPVDAIQRFVGRIELGVIPQIIDTVIFIKDGFVSKTMSLNLAVKVPSGMNESDLARPIVMVHDFETKKLEYEMYSYGDETVVVPVIGREKTPSQKLAQSMIEKDIKKLFADVYVDIISDNKCIIYLSPDDIPKLIGPNGKNIRKIEERLGLSVDVKELTRPTGESIRFEPLIREKDILFRLDDIHKDKQFDLFVSDEYLL
ncbi:ATPase, partial [Candidatus Woesearchaeota archaeon CG_4_10_14_0_8_um_filter_47_5]